MRSELGNRFVYFLRSSALLLVLGGFATGAWAQCVSHPRGRTALRFSNQSRHELAFFIDDSDEIVLAPKATTPPLEVEPGEHMLRARAMIRGQAVWVWTVNEVPRGQICTWSVHDPDRHLVK